MKSYCATVFVAISLFLIFMCAYLYGPPIPGIIETYQNGPLNRLKFENCECAKESRIYSGLSSLKILFVDMDEVSPVFTIRIENDDGKVFAEKQVDFSQKATSYTSWKGDVMENNKPWRSNELNFFQTVLLWIELLKQQKNIFKSSVVVYSVLGFHDLYGLPSGKYVVRIITNKQHEPAYWYFTYRR